MSKVLIIGIDSLAPELLVKYSKNLPNFTNLRAKSPNIHLKSVFPVDSIPAWASIYTGWNPARHGIVKTFDVFDSNLTDILSIDANIFKGKTFWDYASKSGKKVCVLYPLLAFPPWEMNGIMVSKAIAERKVEGESEWIVEKEIRTYPSWVSNKYDIPKFMKGITGKHPGVKNLKNWSDDGKKALMKEAELGLKICKTEEWDLFFIYLSWLDIIQHRLWRFSDENDPSYPGANPYKDIIKDFYQIIDKIIEEYINLCPDATTIVFSDHGHGMRPTKVVNINKVLREEGLLFSNNNLNLLDYIMEKIKICILYFVERFELDHELVDLSTKTRMLSSVSKNVYMSSNIKKEKTIAHLSAFAGVKSYPHGGIEIKKENLSNNVGYEQLRDCIIEMLLGLKYPESEKKLVEWACKREELYEGQWISKSYPDIVFQLREGLGVGWNKYSLLMGKAYDHNLASGGHTKDAVFLISNCEKEPDKIEISLMDLTPIVLDLLNIDWKRFDLDGQSIFK